MANEQFDFNLKAYAPLLATGYGEGADQDYQGKLEILSSMFNRIESGREEFGANTGRITDVLQKGYYAYSKQSPKYMEAIEQKFPDKASENSYKEFVAILSGILKGKVKKTETLFFLKPSEMSRIRKQGKRVMDLDLLEETGKNKDFIFLKYKQQKLPGKGKNSKKGIQ